MQWQPIDTFSEDSERVFGVGDFILWNGERVFVGWLCSDGWHDSSNQDHDDVPEPTQPTHWMPLPEPPK